MRASNDALIGQWAHHCAGEARLEKLGISDWAGTVRWEREMELVSRLKANGLSIPGAHRDETRLRQKHKPSPSLRFSVFTRDSFSCVYCGRHPPAVFLHVDHRIPISRGGKTVFGNLQTTCAECNAGKSDKLMPGSGGA